MQAKLELDEKEIIEAIKAHVLDNGWNPGLVVLNVQPLEDMRGEKCGYAVKAIIQVEVKR